MLLALLGCTAAPVVDPPVSDTGDLPATTDPADTDAPGDTDTTAPDPFVPDPSLFEFLTGFEDDQVQPIGADALDRLTVTDNLGTATGDLAIPDFLGFYYEDGTADDRWAKLEPDPVFDDQVLRFRVDNAAIDSGNGTHTKGRVQTGLTWEGSARPTELFLQQQVYLGPDLDLMHDYPATADTWWLSLTIMEFWFGRNWQGDADVSRISPALFWLDGETYLFVSHDNPAIFEEFWSTAALDQPLPVGEWFTLTVGYRQGDASTGRFVVTATRADGTVQVLADVTDWTYNPNAATPWPLTDLNPQKIYASDNVLHHIRDQGGAARVDFDDFGMASSWPPDWP